MMGIITPRWLVRLQVLFGPQAMLLRSIYAVYPSRRHLAAKVRVFVESIAKLGMTPGIS